MSRAAACCPPRRDRQPSTSWGDVESGGSAGADDLEIIAEAWTAADSGFNSRSGGAVSISGIGETHATVDANLDVNFGSDSSDIRVADDIIVEATQETDSDSRTRGGSGGGINVTTLQTRATAQADVDLTVGATNIIDAGGLLRLYAEHGPVATATSNGTVQSTDFSNPSLGDASPGTNNFVDFGVAHELNTGATVTFISPDSGGLEQNRDYTVIVRNDDSVHLGGIFQGQVNATLDTITIEGHNFEDGDSVFYHANGLTQVGGLENGRRYLVTVVDDSTIKLDDPTIVTPDTVVDRGDIADNTVNENNGFVNGDVVTYRTTPAAIFLASVIDADVTVNMGDIVSIIPDGSDRIFIENHGFAIGEEVVFRADGPETIEVDGGANLVDGQTYFVVGGDDNDPAAADPDYIRLARTAEDANNEVFVDLVRDADDDTVYSLRSLADEPLDGLQDGRPYFVVNANAGSFQLSETDGGAAIEFDNDGLSGGNHTFTIDGVNLVGNGGGGDHFLVLDLTGDVTGQFDGIGGARGLTDAPSGDGIISSTTTGTSGGAIDVGNATAAASLTAMTDLTVASGANLSADEMVLGTESRANTSATSAANSGGVVTIGSSNGVARGNNQSRVSIDAGANLEADDTITIRAFGNGEVNSFTNANRRGLGSGVNTRSVSTFVYDTLTTIDGNLTAGNEIDISSLSRSNVQAEAEADAGGLGADAESFADARIGNNSLQLDGTSDGTDPNDARTLTIIGNTAELVADEVSVSSNIDLLRARAYAETDVRAAGANADANADSDSAARTETILETSSEIIGIEQIVIEADVEEISNTARSDTDLRGAGGDADSHSRADLVSRAKVEGRNESRLETRQLLVNAIQADIVSDATARRDGALFDGGSSSSPETLDAPREIFWEADTLLLGEANPELVVNEDGIITTKINIDLLNANGQTLDIGVGDPIPSADVEIAPIVFDEPGRASFFTNDLTGEDGTPAGQIWGNSGSFEVMKAFEFVRIVNNSDHDLRTNLIDVGDYINVGLGINNNVPLIEIIVDTIPGPTNAPGNNEGLNPDDPTETFGGGGANPTIEFDIVPIYPRTEVEIRNLQPGAVSNSNIVLDGRIENTLGDTIIENQRGSIFHEQRDTDDEIIRTNAIDLDASVDIGGLTDDETPRTEPVFIELVSYRNISEELFEWQMTADAGRNAYIDLAAIGRDGIGGFQTVEIDRITAGNDLILVVNDTRQGFNLADAAIVRVNLFNPLGNNPNNADGPLTDSGLYNIHFRPDDPIGGLEHIFRALGTLFSEVNSNYAFGAVRSGSLLSIGHDDTALDFDEDEIIFYDQTSIGGVPYGSVVDSEPNPNALINFSINTDAGWLGGEPSSPRVFIVTNGNIEVQELFGILPVATIESTLGDVELNAPNGIADTDRPTNAAGNSSVDVTGNNITLNVGAPTAEQPNPLFTGIGVRGTLAADPDGNFLEINSRKNGAGVFNAREFNVPINFGIYVEEIIGTLAVGLVDAQGDVSLRTVEGSVLDGDADPDVDIRSRALDIDVHGRDQELARLASIGTTDGTAGGSLEINTLRNTTGPVGSTPGGDDVSLEADGDIRVTETSGRLRLLYVQSLGGNIVINTLNGLITIIDNQPQELAGTAYFAESDNRLPERQTDNPRFIVNPGVFAPLGQIELEAIFDGGVTIDDLVFDSTTGNDVLQLGTIVVNGVPTLQLSDASGAVLSQRLDTIASLTINGSDGDDRLVIDEIPGSIQLVFNGGDGNDTVVVGESRGNLESVNGLTFNGDAGTDAIIIDDSNNPYSHPSSGQYLVTPRSVERTAGSTTPQLPVEVSFDFTSIEQLTLTTGNQSDQVLINSASMEVTVNTGAGDDAVTSSGGNETFMGGSAADIFRVSTSNGRDVIPKFEPGVDKIDLRGVRDIASFQDLQAFHLVQTRDGVLIDTDNRFPGVNTILLAGFSVDDFRDGTISADDFLFGDALPVLSITAANAVQAEGNSGSRPATQFAFTVTRSGDLSRGATVAWAAFGSRDDSADLNDLVAGTPNSGLLTFATGQATQRIVLSVNGDTDFESDEGFTVKLFDAVNATLGASTVTGLIQNDDSAPRTPVVSLAGDVIEADEGDDGRTPFTFEITRTGDTSAESTVEFEVTGSGPNPAQGNDVVTTGAVVFAPGETSQELTVMVTGDTSIEGDEGFTVTLTDATGANIDSANQRAYGLILNDDREPFILLSIADASAPEGTRGLTDLVFTVLREGDTTNEVTLDWTLVLRGEAGVDDLAPGQPLSGQVRIPAGETSVDLTVQIQGDAFVEPDETFSLTLSNPEAGNLVRATATGTIQNDDELAGFGVLSIVPTTSGFKAQLNGAVDASVLNLTATQFGGEGPADVTLVGSTTGAIAGSLVVSPDGREIEFLATGGRLPADDYIVTLRGATNGFKNTDGLPLDGDANGFAGGNFSHSFTVANSPAVELSVPDFVRGPGQEVNVPANSTDGIPVAISDGAGVRSVTFSIGFDANLLNITGVTPGTDMPAGSTATLNASAPGLVVLTFQSPTDLPAGASVLVNLQAEVPAANASGIYGEQHVLDINDITVTNAAGAELLAVDNDGLHAASFFSDASGNGRINASDASRVARVAAILDGGFEAYPLTDPMIIGDISGNGRLNALDASLVAQFAGLFDVPQIPPLPAGIVIAGAGGLERGRGSQLEPAEQPATANDAQDSNSTATAEPTRVDHGAVDAAMLDLVDSRAAKTDEEELSLDLEAAVDEFQSAVDELLMEEE